jgi:alkylation response protein AidB-like acyl-CoA dehydrogenase
MTGNAISTWVQPLQSIVDPAARVDWARLMALQDELDVVLAEYPVGADLPPGADRSRRLRLVRREIAARGYLDTTGQASLFNVFAQFVCGYRDIDLRDTVGLGHGRLIAQHGCPTLVQQWVPRLTAGELAGIAVTEPHGGSRPAETRTHAVPGPDGTWLVTGRKTWISRLTEAAAFVVFFRNPAGHLTAALVDAAEPGLRREPVAPTGLAGWTWGILDLDAVPVRPNHDVLPGDGMALLREHFAVYRPLVTATALGGAAAVFDSTAHALGDRQAIDELPRLRDSALITLGHAHIQLVTALLGTATAAHLASTGFEHAETWSCAMKAHGIDTAHRVVAELALLLGAAGYRADSPIAKTHRDLGGLLYADGIHDSLYRTAGKHHTAFQLPVPRPRPASPASTTWAITEESGDPAAVVA